MAMRGEKVRCHEFRTRRCMLTFARVHVGPSAGIDASIAASLRAAPPCLASQLARNCANFCALPVRRSSSSFFSSSSAAAVRTRSTPPGCATNQSATLALVMPSVRAA